MADDKKNIPDVASPTEAPAPTVENTAVPEQPSPEPALTDAETVMLEHEGQAALFEMGEAVPDPADAVTHAEVEKPAAPEVPKAEKERAQPPTPGKDAPAPAHSGKVVDFAAARDEAAKEEKKAAKQRPPTEKDKAAKPGRGRPPKENKAAPDKTKPLKPRDKKSQSKPAPEKPAVDKGGAPAGAEVTPEPSAPRDATRAEKEEIVYLNLADLHPFKNHPFGVRDDAEMQGLVESVKAAGVNQPALVRPREDGGYEIIAGHRRQRASELAGFANMPCIVRNMTDDEAILAMTDDNLRHRERILPTEKAQSLKMQVEAIKHQGSRPGEEDKDAGKRSTQVVGDRNGMNYKQVQRYIRLTELVPDLQKILNEFISRIEVHERDKKRAKQAVQHIGIYFSYIGKFENELTQLAEPTEEEIRQMREKIEEAQKEKSRAYHRNYSKEYRAKNLEKRREYERIKAREYRAKRKAQAAALPVS